MIISNILSYSNCNRRNNVSSKNNSVPTFRALSKDEVSFNNSNKIADIQYHKAAGEYALSEFSKDYVTLKDRIFIEHCPQREVKIGNKIRTVPERPAHYEDVYEFLPHYHIDKLISKGQGSGTKAVQMVAAMSKNDPITAGRVTVDACCIDEKTAPGGFYYKLGFRFIQDDLNKECEQWIKNGGKRENAPFVIGMMYLPKENINYCLSYK